MKFFRRTAVSVLFDHKRNEEILEALKVEPANENWEDMDLTGYNM